MGRDNWRLHWGLLESPNTWFSWFFSFSNLFIYHIGMFSLHLFFSFSFSFFLRFFAFCTRNRFSTSVYAMNNLFIYFHLLMFMYFDRALHLGWGSVTLESSHMLNINPFPQRSNLYVHMLFLYNLSSYFLFSSCHATPPY